MYTNHTTSRFLRLKEHCEEEFSLQPVSTSGVVLPHYCHSSLWDEQNSVQIFGQVLQAAREILPMSG